MVHGKYTLTLDTVINSGYNLTAFNDFPIFDEKYRNTLVGKIIENYRFNEIGFETPMLFNQALRSKLFNIMDKYNQLYNIELVKNKIGIEELIKIRYREHDNGYTTGNNTLGYVGTIHQHGSTVTDTTLNEDTTYGKTVNNTGTQVNNGRRDNNLQTITTDYSKYKDTTQNGGELKSETATLTADTPQSEPPINSGTGGTKFDDFNNGVFSKQGYVSSASKNLNVTEDNTETTSTHEGLGGKTYVDQKGYYTDTNTRTDNLKETLTGTDYHNAHTLGTTTPNLYTGNNYTTNGYSVGTSTNDKYGNPDYLESIVKAREQVINIDQMIIDELRPLFLFVF
jgi:hypothetical protein